MNKTVSVSVIIPFYNGIEWLKMIFIALARQSFKNFEVILADDGSREDVIKQLNELIASQPFKVTHLWHEDKGFRKNIMLNRAIMQNDNEYLIFLDGDCIPHHKFVEEHYKARKEGVVIAGRRVDLPGNISESLTPEKVSNKHFERNLTFPLLYAGLRKKERHMENCIRITNKTLRKWLIKQRYEGILGCNFSIFKSDLLKVNGFDERFVNPGTGEDTDLEYRLKRIGIRPFLLNHYITVYHKKHKRLDVNNEPNQILFNENNDNNVGWTPYGVVKTEA